MKQEITRMLRLLIRNAIWHYKSSTKGFGIGSYARIGRHFSNSSFIPSNEKPPWKVLFLGTDDYALKHLKALNENRLGSETAVGHLEAVVTTVKCPVYRYAKEHQVKVHVWPLPDMAGQFDVGVIVSFGVLIPERVIQMFPRGILNVHPSLLPKFRGAAPVHHTILSGDEETAISVMEIMPHQFDVGPLLAQVRYPVPEGAMTLSLRQQLATEGSQILLNCLEKLNTTERKSQDPNIDPGLYAKKFSLKHTYIDWELESVDDIDRHYRALNETLDLRSIYGDKQIRLLKMVPPNELKDELSEPSLHKVSASPGQPKYLRKSEILCIKCQDGWVGFREVNLKKPMTAKSFYNGYLSKTENSSIIFESRKNCLQLYLNQKNVLKKS